jgi:hypothetical protein
MYSNNKKIVAAPEGANTQNIIDSLIEIIPASIENIKPHINNIIKPTGNPLKDAENLANYVKNNFTYIADSFKEQNIKTPGRLFNDKTGDCKSFSLFILSGLLSLNYEAGFRFASYKPNKQFTHVYNFVKDKGKIFTFDSCIQNLKESKNYTALKDMKVNYLTGIEKPSRKERRQKRKNDRQEKRKDKPGTGKKIVFAPARNPFLLLVSFNFRNLAKKLNLLNNKNPKKLKDFWLKVGGNPNKLMQAINTGKNKKPLAGGKINGANSVVYTALQDQNEFIGLEPASTAAAISAAAVLLATVQKLFKGENIEGSEETIAPGGTQSINLDANFEAMDPDGEEAQTFKKKSFIPSIGLIAGAAAAAGILYFTFNKSKKRK